MVKARPGIDLLKLEAADRFLVCKKIRGKYFVRAPYGSTRAHIG